MMHSSFSDLCTNYPGQHLCSEPSVMQILMQALLHLLLSVSKGHEIVFRYRSNFQMFIKIINMAVKQKYDTEI